jgi:uncharacterized membrane protein YphA (DoxX/SURF4 family)
MTLLRAASRTLLASYFVASGVKALRDPDALVEAAQPVADRLVPLLKQYAPAQVANVVPEDTKTLVRVNGAAQVFGGLALATGKGRRLGALVLAGSLVPSTLGKYPFWTRTDPIEKAADRTHFSKNLSLLGGVLLAAGDTEGKPSLVWRAQKGGQSIAKDTRRAGKKLGKKTGRSSSSLGKSAGELADSVSKSAGDLADSVSKSTSQLTDSALAGGVALVGAAVASGRKAKKEAAKQFKAAQEAAAKQAAIARKQAVKQAAIAREAAVKQAEIARKRAVEQAEIAKKQRAKQAKIASKRADKVKKNIKLGEN